MVEFSVASGDACAYKYYHIPMFAFVGVVGGVLGALFNKYTFTLGALRRDYIDKSHMRSWIQVSFIRVRVRTPWLRLHISSLAFNILSLYQVLLVALITGSIFVTVPGWFECRDMEIDNFLDKEQVNPL